MKIQKTTETTVALSTIPVGECFMQGADQACMRLVDDSYGPQLITVLDLTQGSVHKWKPDTMVVPVDAVLHVSPKKGT